MLYDRWEEEEDDSAPAEKSPLTRTLDKKEVEDEVADALAKLGHTATLHCLDGSVKSLHALAEWWLDNPVIPRRDLVDTAFSLSWLGFAPRE